jgi:hypothetical protein
MTTLFQQIKRLWRNFRRTAVSSPIEQPAAMPRAELTYNEGALVHLLHLVQQTEEGVYSCQETFDLLDEYVEFVVQRANGAAATPEELAAILPYVERHLELCPDCRAASEALLRILVTEIS